MLRTPQQKTFELEQKARLLGKEKAFLKQKMINVIDKSNILDCLMGLAEQVYSICIRKNSPGNQRLRQRV